MNDNDDLGRLLRHRHKLLTEEELASMLGLKSVATLATWRHQRQGPAHVKLGKAVFYREYDINQWVDQCAA